ncbi:MAG: hypothetical protein JWO36_2755 [Myxococcales bacterium]|nr:hypothetical protein [Myxococcales bacterium]
MTERSIVEAAARLRRHGEPHLIATVVAVQGSAYRRPGARMLLTQFRWLAGSVSGGCLEGDLSNRGWWKTRGGEPVVVTYNPRDGAAVSDDVRSVFGLGCDGIVQVLLERAGLPGRIDALEFAAECLRAQRRGAVVTVFRSDTGDVKIGTRIAVRAGEDAVGEAMDPTLRESMIGDARIAIESGQSFNRCYTTATGTLEALVEAILPPPRLFVFGTGHDAVPVVELARALGWDVSICTGQPRMATRQRFTRAGEVLVGNHAEIAERIDECDRPVAVIMGHDHDQDRENLGMLLETRARYIGVLGPRPRTMRMVTELDCKTPVDDGRIHAPVGLELGAETPEEVALAIIAEIQAVLRHAPATSLKSRVGRIHDRSERPTLEMAVA